MASKFPPMLRSHLRSLLGFLKRLHAHMSFQCSFQQFVRWAGLGEGKRLQDIKEKAQDHNGVRIRAGIGTQSLLHRAASHQYVLLMVRIYLPIQLFTHSTTHPHMGTHQYTHSSIHPSTHHSTIHSSIHLLIHPLIHPSITHLSIQPSTYPFLPPFLSSFKLFIENLEVRHLDGCWGDGV